MIRNLRIGPLVPLGTLLCRPQPVVRCVEWLLSPAALFRCRTAILVSGKLASMFRVRHGRLAFSLGVIFGCHGPSMDCSNLTRLPLPMSWLKCVGGCAHLCLRPFFHEDGRPVFEVPFFSVATGEIHRVEHGMAEVVSYISGFPSVCHICIVVCEMG